MRTRRYPKFCGNCKRTSSPAWHRQRGNNKFFCDECQTKKRLAQELEKNEKMYFDITASSSISTSPTESASENAASPEMGPEKPPEIPTDVVEETEPKIDSIKSENDTKTEGETTEITTETKRPVGRPSAASKKRSPRRTLTRLRSEATPSSRPVRAAVVKSQQQNLQFSNGAGGTQSKTASISSSTTSGYVKLRNKSRRYIFKVTKPEKASTRRATVSALESLWHKGQIYQSGDVVAVIDEDNGNTYYGLIRGLLRDEYCQHFAALTWLLPTVAAPLDGSFDLVTYVLGPEDEQLYSLDSVEFICHSSDAYFKARGATVSSGRYTSNKNATDSLNPRHQFFGITPTY